MPTKFKLGIQMLDGNPIYIVNCTKSARMCATKFSDFLGWGMFLGNVIEHCRVMKNGVIKNGFGRPVH